MILFAHDLLRKTGARFPDHAPKKKPRGPEGLRGEAKAKSSRVGLLRHAQLLRLDVVPAGAAHLAIAKSVFAAAISLLAAFWPGAIMAVDFIMLSEVPFIIEAETGATASAESMAAASSILM